MEHDRLKGEYLSFWSGYVFDGSSSNFMIFINDCVATLSPGGSNFPPGCIPLLILLRAQSTVTIALEFITTVYSEARQGGVTSLASYHNVAGVYLQVYSSQFKKLYGM
jgi:hypothetical protein